MSIRIDCNPWRIVEQIAVDAIDWEALLVQNRLTPHRNPMDGCYMPDDAPPLTAEERQDACAYVIDDCRKWVANPETRELTGCYVSRWTGSSDYIRGRMPEYWECFYRQQQCITQIIMNAIRELECRGFVPGIVLAPVSWQQFAIATAYGITLQFGAPQHIPGGIMLSREQYGRFVPLRWEQETYGN
jgi:hypothetical protein